MENGILLFPDNQTFPQFNVNGDSMSPTINSNSVVTCIPLLNFEEIEDNLIYVIIDAKKSIWVKRVQLVLDEKKRLTHLRLISDNKEFDPFLIELSEIHYVSMVKKAYSYSTQKTWFQI